MIEIDNESWLEAERYPRRFHHETLMPDTDLDAPSRFDRLPPASTDNNGLRRSDHSMRGPLVVLALSLAISAVIFAAIFRGYPEYLRDYRQTDNPDALHYVLLGRNVILKGFYSRCEVPPFAPDMFRTPMYPLFAGGLDVWAGAAGIYVVQAIIHAVTCCLVFVVARRHFGTTAGWFAGLLLATDLMLAISNFEAMSEPLFNFFTVLVAYFLLVNTQPDEGKARRFWRLVLGGLSLSAAVFTRPAGQYLLAIYAVCLLIVGIRERKISRAIRDVVLLTFVTVIPLSFWVARNYLLFSVPKLTYVSNMNLTYYVSVGAYQVEFGVPAKVAQEMVQHEFGLPPLVLAHNEWLSGMTVAELDAALDAAWRKALFKYPRSLALASVKAVVKASVSHNVGVLARMTGREWKAPGMGDLVRLRPEAFSRLLDNGTPLAMVFVWQLIHIAVTLLFAFVGLALSVKLPKNRGATLVLAAIIAYFYATVMLFGPEAYCRCRSPILPFLYILSGSGLAALWRRVRNADCSENIKMTS